MNSSQSPIRSLGRGEGDIFFFQFSQPKIESFTFQSGLISIGKISNRFLIMPKTSITDAHPLNSID